MSEHYIYQYWVVREDEPSVVVFGPTNSIQEARDQMGYNSYYRLVKTKHKVLGFYED